MTSPSPAPDGTGRHPILMVAIAANDLAASKAFYQKVFAWQAHQITPDILAVGLPAGPAVTLRANTPAGFQGVVPFVAVPDIDQALASATAAGGSLERAPWSVPMAGKLARFRDPSGTIYGLTSAMAPGPVPPVPAPLGANPKPPAGTVCSLEMYAADRDAAAAFLGSQFGWGAAETMPGYTAFNPGAGIGGVLQSHTPAMPAVAYVFATEVEAKLGEIEAAGGKAIGSAMRVPGVACFGYFTDPSGTTMGLIGP
ncbi:MAG: VOC family protein [Gemmatimonadales bacterium]